MDTQLHKVVTPEEYKALIAIPNPTPIDLTKIKCYEEYMENCRYLDKINMLPEAADAIVSAHNTNTMNLLTKENKTANEEKALQSLKTNEYDDVIDFEKTVNRIRTLAKSGSIDAFFIIASVLNLGFILVMAILKQR